MYSLASANESYNTRQNVKFKIKPQIRNTVLASNSIVHVGPQIWNSIPEMLYTNKGLLATAAGFAFRYKRPGGLCLNGLLVSKTIGEWICFRRYWSSFWTPELCTHPHHNDKLRLCIINTSLIIPIICHVISCRVASHI